MRLIDADALMPRLEFIREAEHQIFYGKKSWGFVGKCITAVEDAPTIEEQKWIPCSPETMPKKTGYYLVQYTRKYCRNEMAVAFYSVEEARCDDDYTWEIETFSDIKDVIAWMSLPKPYKERREDKRKT